MRRALIPGLLQNAADNLRHTDGCALFEVGRVFLAKGDGQTEQPDEPYRVGILLAGTAEPAGVPAIALALSISMTFLDR